ncbi:MAG: nicotinate (nicotinamide) nucleotide adenylyltransferase [Anaerolineae bacterium]|nr:nicotinate (nicotinamide) nucleotide adenylyltransferase [Anaerolineae bacterium]
MTDPESNHHSVTRLGIYGGTFDPPHLGHLILAETAADCLNLSRVLFVPAADPPHKAAASIRTPAHHRHAMVERAIAGNIRFAVSRVDMDRPGPHYSVDMLRLLHKLYPSAALFFLIGADSLHDLPTWHRPADLIQLADLGVMKRVSVEPDLNELERHIPGISRRVQWIDAPLIEISATDLARQIAAGYSTRYRLPDAVRAYINEHGLYRNTTA